MSKSFLDRYRSPEYQALLKESGRKLREGLDKPMESSGSPLLDLMGAQFRANLESQLSRKVK